LQHIGNPEQAAGFKKHPIPTDPFSFHRPTNMINLRKPPLNTPSPSDEELARSAQQGKQDAFVMLYERYFPNVLARVRFKVPENDVEDVTQEIFIAVMKSLGGFKGQAKFSTWLCGRSPTAKLSTTTAHTSPG
jgi:hypothetical protein